MNKYLTVYLLLFVMFGSAIYVVLDGGRSLVTSPTVSESRGSVATKAANIAAQSNNGLSGLADNMKEPLSRLFLQLIVIVVTARLFGTIFTRIGQPAVIGEMVAGILLGPSLLGWLAPNVSQFIFASSSLATLKLLSQIGVCLFMFAIGMELDVKHLRHQATTALFVSHISILFPYLLGVIAAVFLYSSMAAGGTSFVAFALFMGISMSITAFPVLARILQERGLARTPLGSIAITCAAVDDVSAWTILAFVVAIVKSGGIADSIVTIGFVVAFVGLMILVVRPKLPQLVSAANIQPGTAGPGLLASILAFVMASALITEVIGIHALFGAFMAGVIMPPQGEFREWLRVRVENFSSVFLLPLFFAFTGLRTQIGLLNESRDWVICVGLILIASLGKLGGSMVTARITGMKWKDSFMLGALMNTRGLVELIALNIGYDLGILSPQIFTMLVLMALVTTFLTGPLLTMAERRT